MSAATTGSPGASGSGASVAVLGAGLAGLRAATALARRGLRVEVFEAREEVGGRVRGCWAGEHWMDGAWPVLGSRDAALAAFAHEVGQADAVSPLRPLETALWQDGAPLRVEGHSLDGAARILGRIRALDGIRWPQPRLLRWSRLMARHAPLLDPDEPERAADLDYRSVADHVALYFGGRALDLWLTPEIQGHHGDDVASLSRVALLQHRNGAVAFNGSILLKVDDEIVLVCAPKPDAK